MLDGKTILVTGGTGTFGKAFVKHILSETKAKKVIVFSRDEFKQSEMERDFKNEADRLRFFNGDIRDRERLLTAFRGVDYVVHAAAMKQVPACEYNPFEAIKTNVMGAQNIIEAAIANKVKRVVAISTDKAVAPINLYGATKLAMERLFLSAGDAYSPKGTTFGLVRYGNVCGSRGSVIPFFMDLHKSGVTEFPVTHPDMTRFNIFIEEGVQLVVDALKEKENGLILIPKIPSFKIVDLVEAINPKATVKIVGIRKGEKIHETLMSEDEIRNYSIRVHDSHYVIDTKSDSPIEIVECGIESYSSGNEDEFLTIPQIQEIIIRLGYV